MVRIIAVDEDAEGRHVRLIIYGLVFTLACSFVRCMHLESQVSRPKLVCVGDTGLSEMFPRRLVCQLYIAPDSHRSTFFSAHCQEAFDPSRRCA